MNDLNAEVRTSNAKGYILAVVGMAISVVLQIVYFNFFGLVNWLDAIVPGILAGACIFIGFKLGKGTYTKAFPVMLTVIAVIATILGFVLGVTFFIYNISDLSVSDAFLVFLDEYLYADIQGTTFYHSQGIIDFGISTGIAVLIVSAKHYWEKAD